MRKIVFILISTIIVISTVLAISACSPNSNRTEESKTKILFLGDSIAEGIIGISPEEERVNYAYYGILGQINDFVYENRAISGNQTKEFLQYITTPESDGNLPTTHIATSDIICISITGNDLLFHNFPCMFYEMVAKKALGDNYTQDERVQACYLYHNNSKIDDLEGNIHTLEVGDGLIVFEECKTRAAANLGAALEHIRKLNPKAKIFFQNTYDPVDDESEIIATDLAEALKQIDPTYDFSTAEGVAKYREMGRTILGAMSDILKKLCDDNDNVYFVDVSEKFDEVYRQDMQMGKDLIFVDGVHPSNKGHAMIARIYQQVFVDMGLATKNNWLAKYKEIRLSQFDRLYKAPFNAKYGESAAEKLNKFKADINSAKNMEEVDIAYFTLTDDLVAQISSDPIANKVTNNKWVKSTETYDLSRVEMTKASEADQLKIDGYFNTITNPKTPYLSTKSLTLGDDGVAEIRLTLQIQKMMPLLKGILSMSNISLDGMVIGGLEDRVFVDENGNEIVLKLAGAMDSYNTLVVYANELFPGMGFGEGGLGENFGMLYKSLGFAIEGIEPFLEPYTDYKGLPLDMGVDGEIDPDTVKEEGVTYNSYLDYLLAYLSRYTLMTDKEGRQIHVDRLPDGLLDKLAELETITIVIKEPYSLEQVKSYDNVTYDVVYLGQYYENTSPYMILTKALDDFGDPYITYTNQMVGLRLTFNKVLDEEE